MGWESVDMGSVVAPLILTPEQYYGERRDDGSLPVKRLMLAVLEDALNANAKNRARQLMYWEAEQWLCQEAGNELFSFSMVCETLGIAPDYLRSGLRQWRQRQSRGENERRLGRRSPVARDSSIPTWIVSRARPFRDRGIPGR